MVFPSLPIYLDPPNWSQQQANQQAGIGTQNPTATVEGGGYQGSIRPGSMADRARLAKIHQPDAAMKCPRCESPNTKFCYYNNYSLSQPRHFCKTCRRYWTRGGALRNVPVGGGCRRNKRSKGNAASSKSPLKPDHHRQATAAGAGSSSASANSSSNNNGCTSSDVNAAMGHLPTPAPTQFPFLASLHHYNSDYVSGGTTIGSLFGATPTTSLVTKGASAEFQIGGAASSVGNNGGSLFLSNGLATEQWRLPNLQQLHHHHQQQQQQHQQFPFLTNLEPQIGLFQFGGSGENNNAEPPRFIRSKAMDSSSSVSAGIMPQLNTIKMEENHHQGLSLPKNLLSGSGNNNDLFWNGSGNAWSSEVPSFTPSPSHLL